MRNSAADIGTDTTGATLNVDDDANSDNNGFAIRCSLGGYVSGKQGTLSGTAGGQSFSNGCIDSVSP